MNWDHFYKESNGNQWPDLILLNTHCHDSLNKIEVFVDIGCGTGSNVRFSIDTFPCTLAIDCSPSAIFKLQAKYQSKIKIHALETIW